METRFRYRGAVAFCVWTFVIDALMLIAGVGTALRGSATGAWCGLILFVFFSVLGWFLVSSRADVVVSETGLSRRLWGRTLREVSWGNIKKVRVFAMHHRGYRRKVRVFHILPGRPSRFRFTPSGKIWFDEPADLSALIEHMNRHIAAHGIPVEVQVGANWSDPRSWSTRNRIEPTPGG